MNRKQFIKYAEKELKDLSGNVIGALFYIEKNRNCESQYFVVSKTVTGNSDYWDWCQKILSALPICYYMNSDADEEWWGFANEKDAFIWMTRWA